MDPTRPPFWGAPSRMQFGRMSGPHIPAQPSEEEMPSRGLSFSRGPRFDVREEWIKHHKEKRGVEPFSSARTVTSMMQELGFETKSTALFGRGTAVPLGRGVFGRGMPEDVGTTSAEVGPDVPFATVEPAPPMPLATRLERPFLGRGSIFGRGELETPIVTLGRAFVGRDAAPLSASVSSSLPQLSKAEVQSTVLLHTPRAPPSVITGEVSKRSPSGSSLEKRHMKHCNGH